MAQVITITRRQLYDRVWQEPMIHLARAFGLSDVGLAKICRKHEIPRPPRGYWAKKEFGQSPPQIPLPTPTNDSAIEMLEPSVRAAQSPPLPDEVKQTLKKEIEAEPRIEVAESLRGAHELVSRANQEMQEVRGDSRGILASSEKSALELRVSKATLRRALLIADALLKALGKRGYAVKPGPSAEISGVDVGFAIEEGLETKREEVEDHDLDGSYEFGHSRFNEQRVPSGRLTVRLRDAGAYWAQGMRHTWRDSDKRRVEDCLNKIVQGLIAQAGRLKEHNEEARRREQARRTAEARREEEAKARAEKRERLKAEGARVDALLQQARNWQESRNLRDYIAEVRRTHLAKHGTIEPGSQIGEWLNWATEQADRLDPLRVSPPSILDTPKEELEEPDRNHFRSW